jgi:hypothetical protein
MKSSQEEINAWLEEMKAQWKEMMACQEMMLACLEKMGLPGEEGANPRRNRGHSIAFGSP